MRAINHALTGAFIGLTVGLPLIALPSALLSHFALDAIPHHGTGSDSQRTGAFLWLLWLDAAACGILVSVLAYSRPGHWLLAAFCAFLATAPDFMWIKQFWRAKKALPQPSKRGLLLFHKQIQWFERPVGWVTEATWFGGFVWLLHTAWR